MEMDMKLKLRTRRAETVIHSRNPSSLKLKNTDVQTEEAEECCHGSTVSTSFVSLFMEEDFKKDVRCDNFSKQLVILISILIIIETESDKTKTWNFLATCLHIWFHLEPRDLSDSNDSCFISIFIFEIIQRSFIYIKSHAGTKHHS